MEKNSLLNWVEETEAKFKHVKNKMNGNNLSPRSRCGFPKHETIDELENVIVFNLET